MNLIGVSKGICRKDKTLLNINPDELDLHVKIIKLEKLIIQIPDNVGIPFKVSTMVLYVNQIFLRDLGVF